MLAAQQRLDQSKEDARLAAERQMAAERDALAELAKQKRISQEELVCVLKADSGVCWGSSVHRTADLSIDLVAPHGRVCRTIITLSSVVVATVLRPQRQANVPMAGAAGATPEGCSRRTRYRQTQIA